MKIGIYNLEPYTNIALEKIMQYHGEQGDEIYNYLPLSHDDYDKIYCSSIFTFSKKNYVTGDMICGGTGFDLTTTLPPEIEVMKPKINIGFTTRGCIRHCPFCVVPQKEGNLKVTGDIYDFWDRRNDWITILDNNVLAAHRHFKMICKQVFDEDLQADFIQGLDVRLMTDKAAETLNRIKTKRRIHIAWDMIKDEQAIIEGIKILTRHVKPYRIMCYVLIGYNTTMEEDLYRIEKLKALKIDPFVMPYNKYDRYQKRFARWVNHKAIFKTVEWAEYQ